MSPTPTDGEGFGDASTLSVSGLVSENQQLQATVARLTRERDEALQDATDAGNRCDDLARERDKALGVLREIVRCYKDQDDRMFDRAMAEGIEALAQKDTP